MTDHPSRCRHLRRAARTPRERCVCSFVVERRHVIERLHYATDDWVNMVFTYSIVLTLDPKARAELRSRLKQRIGVTGVDAENPAVAVICTPERQPAR